MRERVDNTAYKFQLTESGDPNNVPYLGDPNLVEVLLKDLYHKVAKSLHDGDHLDQVASECRRVAKVLLGDVPGYKIVRSWNVRGIIDKKISEWLSCTDDDPIDCLACACVEMLRELSQIAVAASTPGVLQEQWDFQVDAVFQQFSKMFCGISPLDQYMMDRPFVPIDPNEE